MTTLNNMIKRNQLPLSVLYDSACSDYTSYRVTGNNSLLASAKAKMYEYKSRGGKKELKSKMK